MVYMGDTIYRINYKRYKKSFRHYIPGEGLRVTSPRIISLDSVEAMWNALLKSSWGLIVIEEWKESGEYSIRLRNSLRRPRRREGNKSYVLQFSGLAFFEIKTTTLSRLVWLTWIDRIVLCETLQHKVPRMPSLVVDGREKGLDLIVCKVRQASPLLLEECTI